MKKTIQAFVSQVLAS